MRGTQRQWTNMHPLRIQSNFASEHMLVEEDIKCARPRVYRAYLTDFLVHNEIELAKYAWLASLICML